MARLVLPSKTLALSRKSLLGLISTAPVITHIYFTFFTLCVSATVRGYVMFVSGMVKAYKICTTVYIAGCLETSANISSRY